MNELHVIPRLPGKELFHGIDPSHPYDAPIWGLSEDIEVDHITYSLYVPSRQFVWQPAVIVLLPNGSKSTAFAFSAIGREWIDASEKHKFSVAFLEAPGGSWNTDGKGERDDVATVATMYAHIRDTSLNCRLPFSADKSSVFLVGYGEGASMALAAGAGETSLFPAVAAIDSSGSSAEYLAALDSSRCYPFPGDGLTQKEEAGVKNASLPMPLFIAGGNDGIAFDFYAKKNLCAGWPPRRIMKRTEGKINPATLWTSFLSRYTRPVGRPGGHLLETLNFSSARWHETVETFEGKERRYITYVPSEYCRKVPVPLVMVLHGYTASMYAIASESRWSDLAERFGFIVVFPQAYPNILLRKKRQAAGEAKLPLPTWNSPNIYELAEGSTDDRAFLHHVVEETESNYAIDLSRLYCTGHSNGCAMILDLISYDPDLFAAVAPVGYPVPGTAENVHGRIPVWTLSGQWDILGMETVPGSPISPCIEYWTEFLDISHSVPEHEAKDIYVSTTWRDNKGVPLFRFTGISGTSHAYWAEESRIIWEDWFSHFKRDGGKIVYA